MKYCQARWEHYSGECFVDCGKKARSGSVYCAEHRDWATRPWRPFRLDDIQDAFSRAAGHPEDLLTWEMFLAALTGGGK